MRELKFRAWDKKREVWLHPSEFKMDGLGEVVWTLLPCERDEIILMQFTGLKDKNGKEIYEGDILDSGCYEGDILDSGCNETGTLDKMGEVTFEKGCFYACSLPIKEFIVNGIEIIGDIYENPNLLNNA